MDFVSVPKESSVVPEEPTLHVGNWTKVVKDEEPSKVIDIAEVPPQWMDSNWNYMVLPCIFTS